MAYAVQADMEQRYGTAQLVLIADRDNDGVIDAPLITGSIADASAVVDSKLRDRYIVPIAVAIPQEINLVVCDIARWELYKNTTQIPEAVTNAYDAAMALLDSYAAGDAILAIPLATVPASGVPAQGAEIVVGDRQFTRDKLRGF